MSKKTIQTRKQFLKKIGAGTLALVSAPAIIGAGRRPQISYLSRKIYSANNNIQIALIGAGGMGSEDTNTALKHDGVKLVAVCDLYDGHLERAKERWGKDLFTTKQYKEILARKDVDAVIIGTPDHWHKQISIDAMRAGKHVYCEKPMVHSIDEGPDVIKVQKETGMVFQVGSQGMSSLGN